jgi:PAS domain S-box-containing protein
LSATATRRAGRNIPATTRRNVNDRGHPFRVKDQTNVDIKRTGTFRLPDSMRERAGVGLDASANVLSGMATPAAILDCHGIVLHVNAALAELFGAPADRIAREPLLGWIRRPNEREAFGREFLNLRQRAAGHAFVRELDFKVQRGPVGQMQTRRSVRVCKLEDGRVLLTCERALAGDPEAELGRAVSRSLDALDQGVLLVGGDGLIVHANPAARALIGDELLGRGFLELVEPRAVEVIGRGLELARAGSWRGDVDLLRLDGEPLPVELALAGGSGVGAPVVVFMRNLGERRRQEFEERLLAQIDRALISSAEPRDALIAAVQALVRGLAADRGVIIMHHAGVWRRWEATPDSEPKFASLGADARPPQNWTRDRGVVCEVSKSAAAEIFYGAGRSDCVWARVALRAPGGVVGYLLIARNQRFVWSDHEQALIAQIASQLALGLANGLLTLETRALVAYQARVLDQTAVLLNSVDAQGHVVTWNRASEQLVGMSADEAKGRAFGIEVARAVDPARWQRLWSTLLREGLVTSELMIRNVRGDEVPIHFEGRLLRDGNEVLGAVFVGLDLRMRRSLEAQVLQSQKLAAVGLMAAGIAHEINNPLTGVVGYSKLLLERDLAPDVRQKVERIATSGERCRKIVEGVLLFSRKHGKTERAQLDLAGLIDRVVRIGEYQWKMHNVRILREIEPDVSVMADGDQIEQVLLNLLSNAVDAMPQGGNVQISLARKDRNAVLSVTDEGRGIPDEIRAHIFDPFFSTKDIGKGTGLGLSISYGIVRDHGGDILVDSKLRRGTTFHVILPIDGAPPVDGDEPVIPSTGTTKS